MRLDRFIESKLAYSAKTVRALCAQGAVLLNGVAVTDGRGRITEFCRVEIDGNPLQTRQPIYLMLHKPKGYVSATTDKKNKTVLDLIKSPYKSQLHLAGRLDFNTTGLIMLTNDGRWSRRVTLPQQKIPKRYWVQTQEKITEDYVQKFAEGFYFRFEDVTTQPANLEILSATTAHLTTYEGPYHQIKRMFGFFNNEVINLHRLSVGPIVLDDSLKPGDSRELTSTEIACF